MIEAFLDAVTAFARERADVRAALLVGSQARADVPADAWSDVDVVLFLDDPAALAGDASWVRAFGEPELTFLEPTAVGGQVERRVLFADGLEVDFALFPVSAVDALYGDGVATAVLARGHRVLHDELGLPAPPLLAPPPGREPLEIANDFWYHALWTAKKHLRGEHVTARFCFEGHLKGLLVELARVQSAAADTWHGSRFAERWADPRVVAALWEVTPRRPEELPAALRRLCDVFEELLPSTPGAAGRRRLEELLA